MERCNEEGKQPTMRTMRKQWKKKQWLSVRELLLEGKNTTSESSQEVNRSQNRARMSVQTGILWAVLYIITLAMSNLLPLTASHSLTLSHITSLLFPCSCKTQVFNVFVGGLFSSVQDYLLVAAMCLCRAKCRFFVALLVISRTFLVLSRNSVVNGYYRRQRF